MLTVESVQASARDRITTASRSCLLQPKGVPRRFTPILMGVREETVDGAYTLVLEFAKRKVTTLLSGKHVLCFRHLRVRLAAPRQCSSQCRTAADAGTCSLWVLVPRSLHSPPTVTDPEPATRH